MDLGGPRRRLDLGVGGVEAAVPDVLPHREVEEEAVLEHHAHLGAQRGLGQLSHVGAVEEHLARRRVVEPHQQAQGGALAAPAGAHQRVPAAGGQLEGDGAEGRLLPRVAEVHSCEADREGERGHRARLGRVGDGDRLVEDLLHALEAAGGLLHLGQHLGELEDGTDDAGLEAQEGDQGAQGHLVLDDQVAAEAERDHLHEGVAQAGRHAVERRQEAEACLALEKLGEVLAEARRRPALQPEDLDHRLPQQILLHGRGDPPDVFLATVAGAGGAGPDQAGAEDEHHPGGDARERELPLQGEHDDEADDDAQRRLDEALEPLGEGALDALHVGGEAGHQVAHGVAGVKARRQRLQVLEEPRAQLAHHLRAGARREVVLHQGGDALHGEEDEEPAEQLGDQAHLAEPDGAVDEVLLAERQHDLLEGDAGQHQRQDQRLLARVRAQVEQRAGDHRADAERWAGLEDCGVPFGLERGQGARQGKAGGLVRAGGIEVPDEGAEVGRSPGREQPAHERGGQRPVRGGLLAGRAGDRRGQPEELTPSLPLREAGADLLDVDLAGHGGEVAEQPVHEERRVCSMEAAGRAEEALQRQPLERTGRRIGGAEHPDGAGVSVGGFVGEIRQVDHHRLRGEVTELDRGFQPFAQAGKAAHDGVDLRRREAARVEVHRELRRAAGLPGGGHAGAAARALRASAASTAFTS